MGSLVHARASRLQLAQKKDGVPKIKVLMKALEGKLWRWVALPDDDHCGDERTDQSANIQSRVGERVALTSTDNFGDHAVENAHRDDVIEDAWDQLSEQARKMFRSVNRGI